MNAINYFPLLGPWKDVTCALFNDLHFVMRTNIKATEFRKTQLENAIANNGVLQAFIAQGIPNNNNELRRQLFGPTILALLQDQQAELNHLNTLLQEQWPSIETVKRRSYSYLIGNAFSLLIVTLSYLFATSVFPLLIILATPVMLSLSLRSIIIYKCSSRTNPQPVRLNPQPVLTVLS